MLDFFSNHHLLANFIYIVLTIALGVTSTILLYKKANQTRSYQLRAYVPTVWTSLGILFTFISIFFSLIVWASTGEDNINGLIYNITPAFSTSIIGIIGSIFTSIKNKQYLASIECNEEKAFEQHQYENNISSRGASFSPEVILLEMLKEIKKSREKATKENGDLITCLKNLSGECVNKINAFQDFLEGKQHEILESATNESEKTRNTISNALIKQKNDFEDAVGNIMTVFKKELSDLKTNFEVTTENLKSNFTETIEKQNNTIKEKLLDLNSSLGTKIDTYNSTCEVLITRLIDTTKENLVNESKKRNEELKGFIEEENKKITLFIQEQTQLYEDINGNLNCTVSDIRNLFETDVKQAIEKFAEEQHRVSVETLSEWNSKLVDDANESFRKHSGKMRRNMSILNKRAASTYNSFEETIEKTIDYNRDQLKKALSKNETSIQTILEANKKAIEQVSNEIKAENGDIKQELTRAQSEWKKETARIEGEHLGEIKRIHTAAEQDIQEILTKITKYESAIQQSLGCIKEELINSVSEFKTSINNIEQFIVDNNKGLQEDLRKQIHDAFHINELEVSCQKLKDGIDSTISSLKNNTGGISSSLSAINESLEDSSKKYIDTVVNSNDLLTYINETLDVSKRNITSVAVILAQIDSLNTVADQIEEKIKRIQTLQNSENDKTKRNKRQEQ